MSSFSRTSKGKLTPIHKLPKGPNGRALCRQCQTEVPPSRKTFCSPDCINEWQIRSSPSHAARLVLKRDKGICCQCGTDCLALYRQMKLLMRDQSAWLGWARDHNLAGTGRIDVMASWCEHNRIPSGRMYGRRLWDMDHLVPVVEGGGECGLDNLRTLCIPCHKAVTAELAARRAKARKEATSQT